MDRIVVVIFDSVAQAQAAAQDLVDLDASGSIASYAHAIYFKDFAGKVEERQSIANDSVPSASSALHRFARVLYDSYTSNIALDAEWIDIESDFAGDVFAAFVPGSALLLADVDEDRITPLDSCMEARSGVVLRRARFNNAAGYVAARVAALEAEIVDLDVEAVCADADRKRKLQANVRELIDRRSRAIETFRSRAAALQAELDEKIVALEAKAANMEGWARSRHHERIAVLLRRREMAYMPFER